MKYRNLPALTSSFLLLGTLFTLFLPTRVKAANTINDSSISASVKLSVCGNDLVEGAENCDNLNLNNKTCVSLGYASGTLTCTVACEFNTSNCISSASTPTPTSTSSSTSASTSQSTQSTATSTVVQTITNLVTQIIETSKTSLPTALAIFDVNGSGKIETDELRPAIENWVDNWKKTLLEEIATTQGREAESGLYQKCDVNNDNICDLRDLSILLFYVEK